MKPEQLIYFDYAATTPVHPEAVDAMVGALGAFGNPSSRYEYGRQAAQRVKEDRETVARALGCVPAELCFTSCGTESDNWAIRRGVEANRRKGKHIVTTAIEHAAVLETCKDLERQGYEVTYLKPDKTGRITAEQVVSALRPDTALVSMMLVNNETGALLPVAESVKAVKAADPAVLFHCDAVQGFLKVDYPLARLGADLIAVSGHKIGAPKGIGALYIKNGRLEHTAAIKEYTLNKLREALPKLEVISPGEAPHICAVTLPGYKSEVVVRVLGDRGVCVSSGSACHRGRPSHVFAAMGLPKPWLDGALRLSFSPESTREEADNLVEALKGAADSLFTTLS